MAVQLLAVPCASYCCSLEKGGRVTHWYVKTSLVPFATEAKLMGSDSVRMCDSCHGDVS